MRVIQVMGKAIEWTPCKKHENYVDSGYLVLGCKKCVIRAVEGDGDE